MSELNYLDIIRNRNKGIYIEERDYSVYNITRFFNRFVLVVGCSRKGPINIPILVTSPENFEEIFGKHDYSLERKGSYFHRTVKDLLTESPVICVNLRQFNALDDKYNWQTLSTSSNIINSQKRSNPISDFYNIDNGFWKRSSKELNEVSKTNTTDNNKPLSFVNQNTKPVSILIFKSTLKGFDISVEDWYGIGKHPDYLQAKDYISDYMLEVHAVEGEWNNYKELSVHPKWSKFFGKDGIKKDKVNEFYNQEGVNLLKKWHCCLIPYFTDKKGKDLHIETVINNDVNETGIMCSYDTDIIEEGNIDINGESLTNNAEIDFLSYKKYLTDFLVLSETLLDSPNNAFGYHKFNSNGRTQTNAEGYVHNVKLKPLIISSTTTVEVRPFDASNESYGIINGKKIDIDSNMGTILALHETVSIGNHVAFLVVLTENGIDFRLGKETPLDQELYLPHIDGRNEIVLGYYEIQQDLVGNYETFFNPVTLDKLGFVNPFDNGISFITTDYIWLQQIVFENINKLNPQDYKQQRIYHLWYWLSNNLNEDTSVVIDDNGLKQEIKWIEQGGTNDKWIKIAVKDSSSNISGTNGISYYMKDIEFLSKNNTFEQSKPPLFFSENSIIGYDTFIEESFIKGEINSGDPFFWSISEEFDVEFVFDTTLNQNLIVTTEVLGTYNQKKVVVEGTKYNNGIWNFLNVINYNDKYAIVVQENVINEKSEQIRIFDADNPLIINLYTKNKETYGLVELWDGKPEELYKRLKEKDSASQWLKTLEIERFIESNKVVVDWKRYSEHLELNYFLLGENRKWTRIVDLQRLSETELLVETDGIINYKTFNGKAQTNIIRPIHNWIDTLDFKTLKPFIPRNEVFPDGTKEKQREILDLIAKGTKLHSALVHDKIEWRYLVDSFGGGLYENSKYQLAQLAESKKFALSFINVPSIKEFRQDATKYTTNGSFDTKKLIYGGDRKNNTGASYSLSNSSYAVYLTPYVTISEHGRMYKVPPASHVARLYMSKFNDKNMKIWDAMAGVLKSKITTITGIEEKFSNEELVDLDDFGITTITNYLNITFYLHNQRIAVNENSLLKSIHNREALIELEMSMYSELEKYQWESFGHDLKVNIEDTANSVCETYRKQNAISVYSNEFISTDEMIDAQIGLLNTYVELNGVMGTIILSVSILKNGGITKIF